MVSCRYYEAPAPANKILAAYPLFVYTLRTPCRLPLIGPDHDSCQPIKSLSVTRGRKEAATDKPRLVTVAGIRRYATPQPTLTSPVLWVGCSALLAMEYLPSLTQEFDEFKPSLFGRSQTAVARPRRNPIRGNGLISQSANVVASRTPCRTATI